MRNAQQFFAAELERLLTLSLQPQEALQCWYEEARNLQTAMRQHPEVEIPHEIWHFFFDADIRFMQERIVREFIAQLRGNSGSRCRCDAG